MPKPNIGDAFGLTPTISIDQKNTSHNPRSTVGTLTEIYDYLRLLYARVGVTHCPISGEKILPETVETVLKKILSIPPKTRGYLLAPLLKEKKGGIQEELDAIRQKGFTRIRVNGQISELEDNLTWDPHKAYDVDVVVDRLVIDPSAVSRIRESVEQALELGKGICSLWDLQSEQEHIFSLHAYSQKSGLYYPPLEPQDFSFNSPKGMCPHCQGLGWVQEFCLEQILNPHLSIRQDCCLIASSFQTVRYGNIYRNLSELYEFSLDTPWKDLPETAKRVFLFGTENKWTRMRFIHPTTGAEWSDSIAWKGVLFEAKQRLAEAKSASYRKRMEDLMEGAICSACQGSRLQPYPSAVKLGGKTLHELTQMSITESRHFFSALTFSQEETLIAKTSLEEIQRRLHFLDYVGLHYLTLHRTAPTLSGGESQRVRLASQIGSGLVGITYVLDEPSIGLHPKDNHKLIHTLKQLRDLGNTVLVVEHDEETIFAADHILDFGPGAGSEGGEVLVNGSLKELLEHPTSLTGAYLSGRKTIPIPNKRRKLSKKKGIRISGASHHNLKNIDLSVPLEGFIAVVGVSGSGKSSWVSDILYPALANQLHRAKLPVGNHQKIEGISSIDKVIAVDQSPIGRNPRSNPATYIKLLDEIRILFAGVPESRVRGYKSGRFSFNVREGSCPTCEGLGLVKVDLEWLEESWVPCDTCQGKRFDQETLQILFKNKNIHDVLEMSVRDALAFFADIPAIAEKLQLLALVGMDYLTLGQSSTTLSGGEAQRIKLAKELVRPSTGKTLYILDEPTTGLHFHDIAKLLQLLHALVERGNSLVVIEHNMDLVKTADWVIEMGPEGGEKGGFILAEGTPEHLSRLDTPTGIALKAALDTKNKSHILASLATKNSVEKAAAATTCMEVEGACQNNLQSISISFPRNQIIACCGPSGSGKSSFAFDTLYAEGQRRYIESLSPYARQFVKQMDPTHVSKITGLSPAIAIEQKSYAGNLRSTVGTMTEIHDLLRILFARLGTPHCPDTGEEIVQVTKDWIARELLKKQCAGPLLFLVPLRLPKKSSWTELHQHLQSRGFSKVWDRQNGSYDLSEEDLTTTPKEECFLLIDRMKTPTEKRLKEALEAVQRWIQEKGEDSFFVLLEEQLLSFSFLYCAPSTGRVYPAMTPKLFAFNCPEGMCPNCSGLGVQYGAHLHLHPHMQSLSAEGVLRIFLGDTSTALPLFLDFFHQRGIDTRLPLSTLSEKEKTFLFQGEESFWQKSGLYLRWIGLNQAIKNGAKAQEETLRLRLLPFLQEETCLACQGSRLNPLARCVELPGRMTLPALTALPLEEALAFLHQLIVPAEEQKILEELFTRLFHRLEFLVKIGVGYLSLDRASTSLSGGETQRIRLARQLGSSLTGVLYVLDEPTIGLHPLDTTRVNQALLHLKSLGNTLLLVEHDPYTLQIADYLLDFGPKAGVHGGKIIAHGTLQEIQKNPASLTGAYLSGVKTIPILHKQRKATHGSISIEEASLHNLKQLSVQIPIGLLTCLSGVSGSGKSTLLVDVLFSAAVSGISGQKDCISNASYTVRGLSAFHRCIFVDQNPLGQTARSDVGTYIDLLPKLRELFAQVPAAKKRGLQPKHFSYNHRKGMCPHCWGMGYRKISMQFLPSVKVLCEECRGLRLQKKSLEVLYAEKNFGQYLDMTVEEAHTVFQNHKNIQRHLHLLLQVGLGYLKLGQETATLSGGEAQRLKLCRELQKRSTGQTLYLLDEPTTGLHSEDLIQLLELLQQLVDRGNTVIVIEHHLDILKNADHLIELGPGAGSLGGHVVAAGPPKVVAHLPESPTAPFLRETM